MHALAYHQLGNYCRLFSICLYSATGTGHLTVGKLYGGILIHDNWRKTKFGQIEELRKQVTYLKKRGIQCSPF